MAQTLPTSFLESQATRLTLARQQYFEEGQSPTGVVSEAVFESWARCLRLHHSPNAKAIFQPVTASRTQLALHKNRHLHQAWMRELPRLESMLGSSTCAAMLTDSTGVLIGATCVGRPHEDLMPVATRIGVDLSEAAVGTTAPGIVARTGKPVRVIGGEHFFEGVNTMHCSAAPIRDVHGALAGVLDISSEGVPFGFDAARVVSLYAGAIENHLLISQSSEHLVVRFQVSPELLDSALVALVGIDADGQIAWRNDMARSLLDAQGPRHMSAWPSKTVAETEIPLLLNLPESGAGLLTLPNGLLVWARVEMRAPDGHRGLFSLAPSSCTTRSKEEASTCFANAAPCGNSSDADLLPQSAGPDLVGTESQDEDDPSEQLETLKDRDLKVIERAIRRCGGNVSEAARLLGVSRGLIYRRLREARQGTPATAPKRKTPRGSAGK